MDKKPTQFTEFSIDPATKRQAHVRQVLEALELDPTAKSYFLTTAQSHEKGRTLTIVTRPLAATMFYWFYIRDNDVISKNTLSMFEILLALRAGETPENRTPLTIPIR